MSDILLESIRAFVLLVLVVFLATKGRSRVFGTGRGCNWITAGFCLLLFGSVIDITDNFQSLNRFVVVGDTVVQAFLEKVVGYLGGVVVLAVGFLLWIPRELAERKRVEDKQSDESDLLVMTLENIDQGISAVDSDLRLVAFNKKFFDLLDFPADRFQLGDPFEKFIRFNAERGEYGRGDIDELVRDRVALARKVEPHHFHRVRPNGSVIEIRGKPVEGQGFVTTYTDITEQVRAEKALQESEKLVRNLLDHSPAIIAIRDTEGRFRLINRAYERMFGLKNEQVVGKSLRDVMPEAFSEDLSDYDRTVIETGKPMIHEHRADLTYGGDTLMSVRFPIIDEKGAVAAVGSIATDVTDARMAEQNLHMALMKAEQASRAKSEFLANASHELRTPLNSIIGFSDVLKMETFGPLGSDENKEYVEFINRSGKHLLQVIGGILDLSKIEAGEEILTEEEIDLIELVVEASNLVRAQAAENGLSLHEEIAADLPPLCADRLKIYQILLNLLSNAIKFTPEGGTVTTRAFIDAEGRMTISVQDTGIGIAAGDLEIIMEPFGQVGEAYTRSMGGTGLGLALVKSMAELHGATVAVESELGKGTTVTTRFPSERTLSSTGL
jgi:PAS domain S-box-containing protein